MSTETDRGRTVYVSPPPAGSSRAVVTGRAARGLPVTLSLRRNVTLDHKTIGRIRRAVRAATLVRVEGATQECRERVALELKQSGLAVDVGWSTARARRDLERSKRRIENR